MSTRDMDRALSELCAGLLRAVIATAESEVTQRTEVRVTPPFSAFEHERWKRSTGLWLAHGLGLLPDVLARDCPACGAAPGLRLFTSYDGHDFHACTRCETWFVPRRVDWPLFERYFAYCPEAAALASEANVERAGAQEAADVARFSGYFADLAALVPATAARYLDVGCSVGHSLAAAAAAGFVAHGVEADAEARGLAARRYPVAAGIDSAPAGPFDLISLWETIEHVAAPLEMLRACRDRLSPKGVIALTLPNLDAPSTRMLRDECGFVYGGFNHPGHINLFSRTSFAGLLERAGLALIGVRGLFSDDVNALLARLFRTRRGIHVSEAIEIPAALGTVLNAIGPALALLATASGRAPMSFFLACRTEAAPQLAEAGREWERSQRAEIAAEARRHLGAITDLEVRIAELESIVRTLEQRSQR